MVNASAADKNVPQSARRSSPVIRDGHDNFFTPLRLLFAVLVLVGHAVIIGTRDTGAEPRIILHFTFSYLAVNMFFIASGFLVTKSMVFRGDLPSFVSARVLRIFPALGIHVLFVMLIIGPLATNLPLSQFFTSPDWYLQPLKVLSFTDTDMTMPGIFSTNDEPYGSVPLWTLRYEVMAYVGTLVVFALGLLRRKWMVLAQFVLPSIGWVLFAHFGMLDDLPPTVMNVLRFGIAYGLGATLYAYRDRFRFGWLSLAGLVALCFVFRETHVLEVLMNGILAWFVFRIAYGTWPQLTFLQKLPDLSYGIYIYHWCVLQLLFYRLPDISVPVLIASALVISTVLAAASWYLIEKPALRSKASFSDWLRRGHIVRKPVGELLRD